MSSVAVYCGSSPGADPAFVEAAAELGRYLAEHGHRLIYGGGDVGLMGAAADGALAAGGEVIGVIPGDMLKKEVGHQGVTQLHVVDSMHERKLLIAKESDCFLALPGGIGTLEEIIEVLTWTQLGFHSKACGVLNVKGFFDPLLGFLDQMVDQRFLRPAHRGLLLQSDSVESIVEQLLSYEVTALDKWMDLEP